MSNNCTYIQENEYENKSGISQNLSSSIFSYKMSSSRNELYNSVCSLMSDEKNGKLPYKLQCPTCKKLPEIHFNNTKKLEVKCDCMHIINIICDLFLKIYFIQKKDDEEENSYCKCEIHLKKYESYCTDCFVDLCYDCNTQKDDKHLTHTKIILSEKFRNAVEEINKKEKKLDEDDINIFKDFKIIRNLIIYNFIDYPCYNNYNNLKNYELYLDALKKEEHFQNSEETKILLKIRNSRELKNIIINHIDQINNIESIIIEKKNFFNLELFQMKEYKNLKVLSLTDNNISNINPLATTEFPELETLILSINRLSDDSIDIIHNLYNNMPKLSFINLSRNNFSKYELLKGWHNFKNLKKLFLGINEIYPDFENIKNKNNKFDFGNIEELGLSTGIFSVESIILLKSMKLDNVKILYLTSNNLISLDFVEYMNCPNLEEFWAKSNNFKEFDILTKFKKLQIINLGDNKIENIDELEDFISKLKNIKKILLNENPIKLSFEKYNIIKSMKDVGISLSFNI